MDARSSGRYDGTEPEPRPNLPSGHMIGSINLPYYELFDQETKTFVDKDTVQESNDYLSCLHLSRLLSNWQLVAV